MDFRTFDLMLHNLGDMLGYLLVGVLVIGVSKAKDWFATRAVRRSTRQVVSNSVVLSAFLAEARALTEADRLTVMQFHNGDHFASGASVQKVSVTHCLLRQGVAMPSNLGGDSLHNFPATFMTHLLNEAFEKGYALYSDRVEAKDHWVQRYKEVNGIAVEVVCLIPGFNAKDSFGMIAFSWLSPHELTPECITHLLSYAKRASAYL